jgi:hypothetical protein
LRAAVAAGVLDEARCRVLTDAMKALAFPERSFAALARAAPDLADWLAEHRVRRKAEDARALLAAMARLGPDPFVPTFRFSRALAWERFERAQSRSPPPPVLERLRRERPDAWRALRRAALGRLAALARVPVAASDAAARAALDRFRLARGLVRYEDIQVWLGQNGLDAAGLVRLMREDAMLDDVADPPGLEAAMLDLLILSEGRPGGAP